MSDEVFHKLIVSRFSPKNGCNVPEGEILALIPRDNLPDKKRDLAHYFVSARNRKLRSKFGWVKEIQPFTLDEFIAVHMDDVPQGAAERECLFILLSAIRQLPSGTPVTATYFCRGVIEHKMV